MMGFIIALLRNRVYVKHHKVFEEHPLTAGSLITPPQGCIGTPWF